MKTYHSERRSMSEATKARIDGLRKQGVRPSRIRLFRLDCEMPEESAKVLINEMWRGSWKWPNRRP